MADWACPSCSVLLMIDFDSQDAVDDNSDAMQQCRVCDTTKLMHRTAWLQRAKARRAPSGAQETEARAYAAAAVAAGMTHQEMLAGMMQTAPLVAMQQEGWCWTTCGSGIELTEQGLVATNVNDDHHALVTSSSPMTEGRHFWEVEINEGFGIMVGAARPGMDHDEVKMGKNDTYFISAFRGELHGNGKHYADPQGALLQGDRVGVMLDLDAGWMRFFRNGKRFGPGYTSGVTGPLLRTAHLLIKGDKVTVLPSATAPEGAGAAEQGDGGGDGGIAGHVPVLLRPAEPAAAVVQVEGWCWTTCGSGAELSGQGLVATNVKGDFQLVTGISPMTEGRHYWEVEINDGRRGGFMVGAARPGVDHDALDSDSDTYCIWGFTGGLYGNGKLNADPQGELLQQGDRIGVLLDLDAGWMRFYRNGKRFGPGYTSGVTGPLVRAAQLLQRGIKVTVLPGALMPAVDEPTWGALGPDFDAAALSQIEHEEWLLGTVGTASGKHKKKSAKTRTNNKPGTATETKDQSRPASAEGPSTPAAAAQGSAVALSRIQSLVSPAVEEPDEAGGTGQAGKQSKKARRKQQQKAAAVAAAAAVAQAEAAAQQQQEDARVQQVHEPCSISVQYHAFL
jgi:hypothetical protein